MTHVKLRCRACGREYVFATKALALAAMAQICTKEGHDPDPENIPEPTPGAWTKAQNMGVK